jgi:predicted ATPase
MSVYLKSLTRLRPGDDYPMRLFGEIERIEFTTPVTLLAGDNGCGKTTLVELLANKVSAVRIDHAEQTDDMRKAPIALAADNFRVAMGKRPDRAFFFHAEGFIRYIDSVNQMKDQARRDLERTDRENESRSAFARNQARMAHAGSLAALNSLYENDLSARSHGEGFLDFFGARLIDRGLYLLDEPEAALSPFNQYVLLIMVAGAVRRGCQFVISTHSPVLLACPGARILAFEGGALAEAKYDELAGVRFLRDFLADTARYTAEADRE